MDSEAHTGRRAATIASPAMPASISLLATLTLPQWTAMLAMRRSYQEGQDLWTARELAQLRFLRWLRNAGQMES